MLSRLQLYPRGTILIHGGAIGGDTMADRLGRARGFNIHMTPYFHDLDVPGGPYRGGMVRNECMFGELLNLHRYGYACKFEAFPTKESKGTRGCIRLVERHNKASSELKRIAINIEEG